MLKFEDYQQRKDFAWAFPRLTNDETFFSHLIMSDGAHFHIDGYVNKQNYRFRGVLIEHARFLVSTRWGNGTYSKGNHDNTECSLFCAFNFTLWWIFMATTVAWFNLSDSFLLGYLKGKVYLNKPNTLQEIENNIIIKEISLINSAVLESVSENNAHLFQ